jgi:hypothetical protein
VKERGEAYGNIFNMVEYSFNPIPFFTVFSQPLYKVEGAEYYHKFENEYRKAPKVP